MQVSFTPGPNVEVIHSNGVTINEPVTSPNGQISAQSAGEDTTGELFQNAEGLSPEQTEELSLCWAAISQALASLHTQPAAIADEQVASDYCFLLRLIERLSEANEQLKAKVQRLRDAINLLKGEQAQPKINASKREKAADLSSEQERKSRQPASEKKSKAKKYKIPIDRVEVCSVERSTLPEDAEFKGYQSVVIQEILIKTDNVEYRKEIYYSRSLKKAYLGALPPEVAGEGEFGPGVKSLIYTQKHVANMSEPKIQEFLENVGVFISPATISRILTQNNEHFHREKADIFQAGLTSTRYQQIDDTGARVRGQNQYVQIICNPYYTAYFTTARKDRLSVLDVLQGGQPRSYLFNEEALTLLATFRVSQKIRDQVWALASKQILDEEQMQQVLQQLFPNLEQGKISRIRIMEAGAIAAYHQQSNFPVIPILLSDDAPQFKQLTWEQALCWVHDGRHYKRLHPAVPWHQQELADFREQYWDYYQKLLLYKQSPSQEKATELSAEFDDLFSTKTNYQALNERIAKSSAKKKELLLVLKYPELPLHNNAAELGARTQARKRDVSLHTMTPDGTQAQDTFLTIVQTAKKLEVSAYAYIYDRVSKRFHLPSLAELIGLVVSAAEPSRSSPELDGYDTS